MSIKTIAVLTSGGDAPGMNAAVRAITRRAISENIKVLGVKRGFIGLRTGDTFEMNLRTVSDILHKGGTVLYSSRDPEFKTQAGLNQAVDFCKNSKIDAVIAIGGDGTLKGVNNLVQSGINCVFIPATIDNDVSCSSYSIGFDTALNTAMEMVDKIRDTTQSHEKCSVVEVMGRHCGDIALHAGIAVGATAIVIPEKKFDLQKDIIERIKSTQKLGKRHFIVIVAENCADTSEITKLIEQETKINARYTILGHVQRGGSPTLKDRVMASLMGCHAIDLLISGEKNQVIAVKCDKVINFDIENTLGLVKKFDTQLYKQALQISI